MGDPKQLPATVLIRDKTAQQLYRHSMFQRLQAAGHSMQFLDTQVCVRALCCCGVVCGVVCGASAATLPTDEPGRSCACLQYRMHPAIAKFPSDHFYDGQLKTSASVLAGVPAGNGDGAAGGVRMLSSSPRSPWTRCRSTSFDFAMGTYVVLDAPFSVVKLSKSKCVGLPPCTFANSAPSAPRLSTHALDPRARPTGTTQPTADNSGGAHDCRSSNNEVEAKIVVAAVRWLVEKRGVAATEVGVVTPYKSQESTIKGLLNRNNECDSIEVHTVRALPV